MPSPVHAVAPASEPPELLDEELSAPPDEPDELASAPPDDELEAVASPDEEPPSSPPDDEPLPLPLEEDEVVASSPPLEPLVPDEPLDAPDEPPSADNPGPDVLLEPPHPMPTAIARQSPAQALEAFICSPWRRFARRPGHHPALDGH